MNWKDDLTKQEMRKVLEARGYKRVPQRATKAEMREVMDADDRGTIKEGWW